MSEKVKAGKYKLVALRWRKITSKPGEPLDYIQFRRGDTVDLDVEEARRLLKAGAVVKGKADAEPEAPATPETPPPPAGDPKPTAVKDILADVGEDKEKAQEYLDAETAKGEGARSSLVEKLQAILSAES